MNVRDPDRDVDDLLGDDGGDIGKLYRRLPRYEPPRRLDRAVLGEAARAVHSGKPPRRQRWVVGLGSAAGLVLAAGIAWRVGHDVMTQNESVLPTAAPRVVPVEPISEPARAKHEDKSAQQAESRESDDAMRAEPSAAQSAAGRVSPADELKPTPRKLLKASKPAAPAAAPSAPSQPAAAAPPPQAFPEAAREREQAKDRRDSNAAASGAAAPATRAATAGAAMEKEKSATVGGRALSSPTPPSGSVELQQDLQRAPQDWLAHIRQLDQQGRRQQATESLRLFQRAHPDWKIPDDLRDLLD